jgi:hypothetical protein
MGKRTRGSGISRNCRFDCETLFRDGCACAIEQRAAHRVAVGRDARAEQQAEVLDVTGDGGLGRLEAAAPQAAAYAIGLGADANQASLSKLASQPAYYAYAPDTSTLGDIYQQVATIIRTFNVTDLHVTHALPMGVEYEPLSFVVGKAERPGEWLEYSPLLTVFLSACGFAYLVREVVNKGPAIILDLNHYVFLFLIAGLLLHWRPRSFGRAISAESALLILFIAFVDELIQILEPESCKHLGGLFLVRANMTANKSIRVFQQIQLRLGGVDRSMRRICLFS